MSENRTQVYSVYIEAPAQRVWEAITTSADTTQWGYGGGTEIDQRPGGRYRNLTTPQMQEMGMGEAAVTGEVVEVDPPHRLVLTWSPSWFPQAPPTTVTWELTEFPSGLTRVVLTHDVSANPELAPQIAGGGDPAQGGGGWAWCLSGLKTWVETGRPMAGNEV